MRRSASRRKILLPTTLVKPIFARVGGPTSARLPAVLHDPWLDGLRDSPRFADYVDRVRARHQRALVSFGVAGGPKLLGAGATAAR